MGRTVILMILLAAAMLTACSKHEDSMESLQREYFHQSAQPAIRTDSVDLNLEPVKLSTTDYNYRVQMSIDNRITVYYDGSMYVTENSGWELLRTPEYIIYKEGDVCGISYTTDKTEYYFDLSENLPVSLEEFTLQEDDTYIYVDDRNDGKFWYRLDNESITSSDVLPPDIADDDVIQQTTTYTLELSEDRFVIDTQGWLASGHFVVTPAYGIPIIADPNECVELDALEIINILNGGSLND